MKRFLLSVLILFLTVSCKNKNIDLSDLRKDNLKGDVLGFVQVEYKAIEKFGEPTKGDLILDFSNTNFINTYNSEGNRLEYWTLYGVKRFLSKKYTYNESGKLDFIDSFNSEDKLSSRAKYNYDSDGRISNVVIYNEEGELFSTYEYSYNEKNHLVKEIPTYPLMNSERYNDTTIYEYLGDSVKYVRSFNANYKSNRYEKYNYGKKTEFDSGNDFHHYTYNENGDIATEIFGTPTARAILTYKYKYDTNGNWIELIKYFAPDIPNYSKIYPLRIVYRTITYKSTSNNVTAKEILEKSNDWIEYQESEKEKIKEKYCNEIAVKENIVKGFMIKVPDYKIRQNSIVITPLPDCRYKIFLIIQDKEFNDIQKQIEFVFNYSEDYSGYSISEWKESSI